MWQRFWKASTSASKRPLRRWLNARKNNAVTVTVLFFHLPPGTIATQKLLRGEVFLLLVNRHLPLAEGLFLQLFQQFELAPRFNHFRSLLNQFDSPFPFTIFQFADSATNVYPIRIQCLQLGGLHVRLPQNLPLRLGQFVLNKAL